MAIDESGKLTFVATLFSCLGTVSDSHSFVPLWKPPFISKLAAEDRCHLNGMAMKDGRPQWLTAVSQSDAADSWRDHRSGGGIVIDVQSGRTITTGMSMPHSSRRHNDRLWVLNSGAGEFGMVDLNTGQFQPIAFCPGYLRGLAMHGHYAVIGSSM